MTEREKEELNEKEDELDRKVWELGKLGERTIENAANAITPALQEFANAAA